jgi:hypothetical protein
MKSSLLSPDDIQSLAKAYGVGIYELCAMAQVPPSSFYKWKAGDGDIFLDTYDCLIKALAAARAKHEEGKQKWLNG